MKIRIYHESDGTVRITKVVEQGPEKGKESSMFHNLKPGSMAEVEIDAVLQHQACMKESKSESKEKDDSCNLQKFLQVYAPDMPYITAKKTASKMKISVEDAEKIIAKCKEKGLLEKIYIARCPECGSLIKMDKDRLKLFSIKDCYVCGKNITLENEDIILAYSLSEKILLRTLLHRHRYDYLNF